MKIKFDGKGLVGVVLLDLGGAFDSQPRDLLLLGISLHNICKIRTLLDAYRERGNIYGSFSVFGF